MNDVFVSYSRKDREFVLKLVDALKGRGWNVWWDPTIRPGQYYEDVIEGALTTARCVIVVWSKNSVTSKWVRAEAGEAANRGVLVPVVIDNAKIPFRFKQIQEANLAGWQFTPDHPGLISLLDSIAATLSQPQQPQVTPPVSPTQEEDEGRPPGIPSTPSPSESETRRTYPERAADSPSPSVVSAPIAGTQQPFHSATDSGFGRSSKIALVVAIVGLVVGLIAVVVYFVPSRRSTDRSSADPQASPSVSLQPSPTKTNSASPSPSASPVASPRNPEKLMVLLEGTWQSQKVPPSETCECANDGCLKIQFNTSIRDLCVESNQVFINAAYKLDLAQNKAFLLLRSQGSDLGPGGMRLPWDRMDRSKPLATIDLVDLESKNVIYVFWNGFPIRGATDVRSRDIGGGFQGAYVKR
jgi:hypothetical protein